MNANDAGWRNLMKSIEDLDLFLLAESSVLSSGALTNKAAHTRII